MITAERLQARIQLLEHKIDFMKNSELAEWRKAKYLENYENKLKKLLTIKL